MPVSTLEKVIADVKTLAPAELEMVREIVSSLLNEPDKPQMTEDEREDAFERELMAEGVLGEVKPLDPDDPQFYAYRPVTVEGKPVSETIIEERR